MKNVVKKAPAPEPDFLPDTRRIAALADEHKALDVRAYDLRGLTVIADSFVICTANSEPHVKAISSAILAGMREIGVKARHSEGSHRNGWLVLDYGHIIVHIFRKEQRDFYDLDGLWGDAPAIALDL